MARYVAFLRGMNLGNRRIKNEELRAHFEAMGLVEVATFRHPPHDGHDRADRREARLA